MKATKKRRSKLSWSIKINITLLIAFIILIGYGIFLVRDKLLLNANEMGTALAQSYAAEEQNRNDMYKMFIELSATSIDQIITEDLGENQIQQYLKNYSSYLTQILGDSILDPYAVIDGKIIAAYPWEYDDVYEYKEAEWYQRAISANGNIIFTNAYTDAITGKKSVTIAKKLKGENNVLAFDILLENYHTYKNKASMPEGSSYFLYDGNGKLIYIAGGLDINDPDTQKYCDKLLAGIQNKNLQGYTSTIKDIDGKNRGVYYYVMDNNWVSVITIPISNILQSGWDSVIVFILAICIILIIVLIAEFIRGYRNERKIEHINDTLQILGDTFYAIYRINYKNATYETIKSSYDIKDKLGKKGEYKHFLQVFKECVSDDTYTKFKYCFSVENIRKIVSENIYEYGGDYQRKFNDVFKWVSIKIIYNNELALNEVIMCFREIDAEKRLQLQQLTLLENSLDSAKQSAERKSIFFSNVSHDMRTPLNAIIGLSELAQQNSSDTEKVKNYITKIQNAGKQLLTLINDILDMSRIENKKGEKFDYKPMRVNDCVNDCVLMFSEQALREKKDLIVELDKENVLVYCDYQRLSQILNNLISNAIKYSDNGAKIKVKVKLLEVKNRTCKYQFIVSDTGIGMSDKFLKHIYEPFERETMFSATRVSGTGLGMPIVKSLVQQMSGEITIKSKLGVGSTFTVILPLMIAEKTETQETEAKQVDEKNLNDKTIMVAEDNEINMEILCELLQSSGAKVIKAYNGSQAVEIFKSLNEGSLDAILMDMHMPEMDGCTACTEIRKLNRTDAQKVPIIAVTANAFAEDIAKTIKAGMNGHIAKPIDFKELLKLLTSLIK